ncbi:hypothetical protein LIER_23465 [Lithospermum erythrorhizon]|uniref:GAG-pre-integrase domain-containing protein n=1 Tax=Lithospermum erythrorhizon TaxID=34254 RepID=A0AAV3QZ24_LITER
MGVDFNDEVQVLWILVSLPDSWETLSVYLSVSASNGTISKEMIEFDLSEKLDDQGFFNFFGEGKWKLIRDSKLIVQGIKEGTLYRSRLVALNNGVHVVEPKIDLWHNRLGHISEKGLMILSKEILFLSFKIPMFRIVLIL